MSVSGGGGSSSNRYQAIPMHEDPPLYPPPPPSTAAAFKTKSKGKGRAQPDEEQGLSFGIRFTDGQTPDLVDLWVGHRETVRDLKRRIRILRPETLVVKQVDPLTGTETDSRPRRLRLIQLGRVLPDGVLVVPFTTQLNSRPAGAGTGAGATGVAPPAAPAAAAAAARGQNSSSSSSSDDDDDDDDEEEEEEEEEEAGPSLRRVGKGLLGSVITGVSIARDSLDSSAHQRGDQLDAIEKGQGDGERKKKKRRRRRKGKGARGISVREKQAQQEAPPVWLHCSVGEPMEDEELAAETLREAAAAAGGGTTSGGLEGAQQQQAQQLTPLQGFDRLREAGFTDQDIENLRSEFRAHAPPRGSLDRDPTTTAAAVDDEEHQRALEEQWMSGMTGLDEAATAGSSGEGGHYYSLLKGVCAGFFVPFLPLFFFRTQVFSKRMQIAIVLGIFINLAFGFLRMLG